MMTMWMEVLRERHIVDIEIEQTVMCMVGVEDVMGTLTPYLFYLFDIFN